MNPEESTTTTEPVAPTEVQMTQEQFDELILNMDEQNDLLLQQNEILQQQLDLESVPLESVDYSDSFQAIVSHLDTWDAYVVGGGSALVTYSVFYLPLLVILVALYWFLKQFWTRYI